MLPEVERVLFKNPPLRLVVGQVRFPLLFRFSEGSFVAPFQEALAADYPVVSREQALSFQVTSGKGVQSSGETLLRFSSRGGEWSVVLGEGALTLEVRGYSAVEEFSARFRKVLSSAKEKLLIKERSRLGLRYINEFRHEEGRTLADWAKLLNPALLGFAGSDLLEGTIEHMVQETQVRRPDGVLAIRHGLLVGGVVEPAPTSPVAGGRFYLLDMDYYDARQEPLDVERLGGTLRDYNDMMYRFFRWSLQDTLFRYLVPDHARAR
jgi:uncharacterized protein (TIGR04255 family)